MILGASGPSVNETNVPDMHSTLVLSGGLFVFAVLLGGEEAQYGRARHGGGQKSWAWYKTAQQRHRGEQRQHTGNARLDRPQHRPASLRRPGDAPTRRLAHPDTHPHADFDLSAPGAPAPPARPAAMLCKARSQRTVIFMRRMGLPPIPTISLRCYAITRFQHLDGPGNPTYIGHSGYGGGCWQPGVCRRRLFWGAVTNALQTMSDG